jgi:hypothetical protein
MSEKGPADPHAIPILVGITGHRSIREEDREVLSRAVRSLLDEVKDWAPSSPIVMMSSLAEGADQLAAEVALAAGLQLWVPLPLEMSEYRNDFTEAGSKRLDDLIAKATHVLTLGLAPGNTKDGVHVLGAQRDAQYALASAWILRRSHVLIALWDGEGPRTLGGTADTVAWRLGDPRGAPRTPVAGRAGLDMTDCGPVWQVVTPRVGRATTVSTRAGTVIRKYRGVPDGDREEGDRLRTTLQHIEAFNARALEGLKSPKRSAKVGGELVTADESGHVPQAALSVAERYSRADALALSHQDRTKRAVPWVFGAAFASLFFLDLFAHVFPGSPWLLALHVAAFLVGFVALWVSRHPLHEQGHVDHRALAEGMRVQFFWRVAGSEAWAADSYLRIHRPELDWVREALRGWSAAPENEDVTPANDQRWRIVVDKWVTSQRLWFFKKSRRRQHAHELCRLLSHVSLASGFLVAVALLAVLVRADGPSNDPSGHVPSGVLLLVVLIATLTVAGGLVRAFGEKMGYGLEAGRYRLMAKVFQRAQQGLAALHREGRFDEARLLVEELGQEALVENAEWLLARRERKLEPMPT